MTRLPDGVPRLARPEFDQGAVDPSQMLHHVMIMFTRSPEQQQALDRLIEEQQDPNSPNYHNWLTPEQFAERFGLSDGDLQKVTEWLTSQGFTIDQVSRGHSYIAFSGPAGQINSTFQTEIHQYRVNGEVHFANAISPAVPTALGHVIAGIRSLNDFRLKPRAVFRRVKPDFTSGITNNHFLAPDDFATIYNLKALYAAGIDGTGQKVAVVGQTDIVLGDITTFRSVSGLPPNSPQVILTGSDPGLVTSDLGEAMLDLEWVGAVARNATIIYVNSKDVFTSMFYAIDNNVAPVISISYGLCEASEGSFLTPDNNELQKASAQGQAVVGAAGDSGATDCDNTAPASQGLAVDFPGSSPYVTAIGGTTFNDTPTSTYWNPTSNSSSGSALFYIPEVVWNDTTTGTISSTGGGASDHFAKPSWQTGTGVPSDGWRDVPDVSFTASANTDGYITCVNGDCRVCFPGATGQPADANCPTSSAGGYRSDTTNWTLDIAGGTSAGAPTFAGLLTLINQYMGSPQGSPNTKLYQLAASKPYIFHDIVSGNNKVTCVRGTTDCPSGGSIGFTAAPGYDQVTGLGTPDGYSLVTSWNATPAPDFALSFFNPTISVASGSSATIPISVRKLNGFSGTVTLMCVSAQQNVTCSVTPSTVTPDGSATVTINAITSAALRPVLPAPESPWWIYSFGIAAILGIHDRRGRPNTLLAIAMALVMIATMISCGGRTSVTANRLEVHSSSVQQSATQQTVNPATSPAPSRPARGSVPAAFPAGVIIFGTSGTVTHSAEISVTVN